MEVLNTCAVQKFIAKNGKMKNLAINWKHHPAETKLDAELTKEGIRLTIAKTSSKKRITVNRICHAKKGITGQSTINLLDFREYARDISYLTAVQDGESILLRAANEEEILVASAKKRSKTELLINAVGTMTLKKYLLQSITEGLNNPYIVIDTSNAGQKVLVMAIEESEIEKYPNCLVKPYEKDGWYAVNWPIEVRREFDLHYGYSFDFEVSERVLTIFNRKETCYVEGTTSQEEQFKKITVSTKTFEKIGGIK